MTFKELRDIKHMLPTGSIRKIAVQLNLDEQTVRNYFGAEDFNEGGVAGLHKEPGPDGGIVHIEDMTILNMAKQMISEAGK